MYSLQQGSIQAREDVMDINQLRKAIHDQMFSTVILLASDMDATQRLYKQLNWWPGRKDAFEIVCWSGHKEGHDRQRFSSLMPATDFYIAQSPR